MFLFNKTKKSVGIEFSLLYSEKSTLLSDPQNNNLSLNGNTPPPTFSLAVVSCQAAAIPNLWYIFIIGHLLWRLTLACWCFWSSPDAVSDWSGPTWVWLTLPFPPCSISSPLFYLALFFCHIRGPVYLKKSRPCTDGQGRGLFFPCKINRQQ